MLYSKETVRKIYRLLPQELMAVVATTQTSATNDQIALTFQLDQSQRLELGDEITMRLIGLTQSNNFSLNIACRLKISAEIADRIVLEVNNKIISKVPINILELQEKSASKELDIEQNAKSEIPVIITKETKQAVMDQLAQRVQNARQGGAPAIMQVAPAVVQVVPQTMPQAMLGVIHNSLPMVEVGETVHDVPLPQKAEPIFQPAIAMVKVEQPKPNQRYSGGVDPYREPLQ